MHGLAVNFIISLSGHLSNINEMDSFCQQLIMIFLTFSEMLNHATMKVMEAEKQKNRFLSLFLIHFVKIGLVFDPFHNNVIMSKKDMNMFLSIFFFQKCWIMLPWKLWRLRNRKPIPRLNICNGPHFTRLPSRPAKGWKKGWRKMLSNPITTLNKKMHLTKRSKRKNSKFKVYNRRWADLFIFPFWN